ncbi:hypothetical protein [Leucobacter chromiireducens]|uniref:Secreted protein n=1 Tax=Leucobacter chromiireducens subsp. solipictus TaxID=398235 RepID=A0ABS1SER5_9MICO|nr:hypothetical protein [Leucobacter chromiireducens]MBL3678876.1 hypothetical protein [Leucobacter chromiireducens subsp. solipictus]
MRTPKESGRQSSRFQIALIAGGLALMVLVGIGIYGLLRGPASDTDTRADSSTSETAEPEPERDLALSRLSAASDGERFARAVAVRLFAWDTRLGHGTAEYMQSLIDIADPAEAPGLAADLRSYYPDDAAWRTLQGYSTRQWLELDTATVPDTWARVTEEARPGTLPQGAVAYTITGTRHRAGSWEGQDVSDARPVSFTIFAACPTGDSCRLLRLSAVDTPMP